ncbi:MAG: hypothetical protein KA792_08265, partial [Bacteroidales bacterium]|nr:hypothetical protein [Bacteroidales bacterium]
DRDEEGNIYGGWDLRVELKNLNISNHKVWFKTIDPIIYVTYSILNNYCPWEKLEWITDDTTMIDILKKIAFINIKKIPGGERTYEPAVWWDYEKNKEIVLKQINYYKPDIIICGNTLRYLLKDLQINEKDLVQLDSVKYIIRDNTIIINAYHPQQTRITKEKYFNDIINAVKKIVS